MKYNRFLVSALAIFAVLSLSDFGMVCFAENSASYTTDTNFWHWLSGGIHDNSISNYISNTLGIGSIFGYFNSTDVCANSQDNKHHASSVTGVSDDGYCICVCEHCGNEFTSSTRAHDVYDAYKSSLPAQKITSDGGLIWSPTLSNLRGSSIVISVPSGTSILYSDDNFTHDGTSTSARAGGDCVFVRYSKSTGGSYNLGFSRLDFEVPVTGVYRRCTVPFISGDFVNRDSQTFSGEKLYSAKSFNKAAGEVIDCSLFSGQEDFGGNLVLYEAFYHFPVFEVTPISAYNVTSVNSNDTYNIGTRAASISGDYGIITQSGNVQKIDTQTIINEGDKTYYSPVTGETTSFTDWSYDYSSRSYTLTTDGDTTTITYGDEYVTIQEGSTVTNIYYITETSSGGNSGNDTPVNPDTPSHTHNYSSNITTAPTCTLPGVRTYTCSCGNTYTENVPATGHAWTVKQQVQTEYDENGDLLTQGFTIYRCSVCGEEYREENSNVISPTNPYINSETAGIFTGIFGIFWDFISFMLTIFNDFIVGGIRNFFSSLLDGVGEFFGMLNPMNWF